MRLFRHSLVFFSTLMLCACSSSVKNDTPMATDIPENLPQTFSEEFIPMWERAAEYTLELAQIMPEEYYDYKPTPEIRSFGEQLIHTAQNIYWLNSTYGAKEDNPIDLGQGTLSKAQIIKLLSDGFDYVRTTLKDLSDEDLKEEISLFDSIPVPRSRIYYLMRDHMTHHRAQAIIYLRLKGLEPPSYRGW